MMSGAGLHPSWELRAAQSPDPPSRCLRKNGLLSSLTCFCKKLSPYPEKAVQPALVGRAELAAWQADSIWVCHGPTEPAGSPGRRGRDTRAVEPARLVHRVSTGALPALCLPCLLCTYTKHSRSVWGFIGIWQLAMQPCGLGKGWVDLGRMLGLSGGSVCGSHDAN